MQPQLNMDILGKGSTQGEIAALVRSQGSLNVNNMRPFVDDDGKVCITVHTGGSVTNSKNYKTVIIQANATLRRDEWVQLDEVLLNIARTRLRGVQDLLDKNLTFDLGNAMGTTVLEHHTVSDGQEADMTMDGITRSKGDRPNFETVYTPIPIIHVDYEINLRELEASRKLGNPLDTTQAEQAGRRVAEKLESLLFTDTSFSFANGVIYSYLNHPNRNLATLGTEWNDSSVTTVSIKTQILALKQSLIDAKMFGPYAIYIPTAYETKFDDDYDATTPGTTLRERILKIDQIESVKVIDTLTADNVIMVQLTNDVVRLVRGIPISNIQWQVEGNFITKHKVITIQVPQIRADQDGNSGVVHAS